MSLNLDKGRPKKLNYLSIYLSIYISIYIQVQEGVEGNNIRVGCGGISVPEATGVIWSYMGVNIDPGKWGKVKRFFPQFPRS